MLDGSLPGLPSLSLPTVDVRDVAEAHLQAVLKPDAAGNRFILVEETVWFTDFSKWLNEKYS